MLGKSTSGTPGSFDTIIGVNSKFEGNIETNGTIRVDGKVFGNLIINGDVYIGTDATITGNINANNIFVSGRVDGNIESKGILKIQATAKLYGDLTVFSLVTEEGSIFEGKCKMLAPQAETASNTSKKSKATNVPASGQ